MRLTDGRVGRSARTDRVSGGDLVASADPDGAEAVALASEPERSERAGFAPELIAGAVVVAAIGRRRRPGFPIFSKRRNVGAGKGGQAPRGLGAGPLRLAFPSSYPFSNAL